MRRSSTGARPCARSASADERVDLPQPRCPRRQRLNPAVAPVGAVEDGGGGEAGDAFGHDERPRLRGGGSAPPRRAPGRARRRRARCPSARGSRRTAGASAALRSRPGRRAGPARRGGVPTPRRRSTSQRSGAHARGRRPERRRTWGASPSTAASPTNTPPIVLSRTSAIAVGSPAGSGAESLARLARRDGATPPRARPGTPNHDARTAAGRRRQPLDVLRDAPVLGDGGAHEDAGEHRRGGCDPERRPERTAVAAAEPPQGERDDVPGAAHSLSVRPGPAVPVCRATSRGFRRPASSTSSTSGSASCRRTASRTSPAGTP